MLGWSNPINKRKYFTGLWLVFVSPRPLTCKHEPLLLSADHCSSLISVFICSFLFEASVHNVCMDWYVSVWEETINAGALQASDVGVLDDLKGSLLLCSVFATKLFYR